MSRSKIRFTDVFVIGFAMFAVFFGAGNLIFPPFLGMEAGKGWFLGFFCFVLADVGLAILTMLVLVKRQDAGEGGLLSGLGKIPAKIIWDISTVAYFSVPGACRTQRIPSPVLNDDKSWSTAPGRKEITVVRSLDRAAVFADLFAKLATFDAAKS